MSGIYGFAAKRGKSNSNVAVMKPPFFYELSRKFLNKAILIGRAAEEMYLPLFDHQWIETIASLPISEREDIQ